MKAILHIGDQKCGSSAIQLFLRDADVKLGEHGLIVPKSTKGADYDIGLAALAVQGPNSFARRYRNANNLPSVEAITTYIQSELEREASMRDGTFVFSFEGLLWLSEQEIKRLKAYLDRIFSVYQIVTFLRRQDRKAVSAHTTALMHGKTRPVFPRHGTFGYRQAALNWLTVFPEAEFSWLQYEAHKDTAKSFATQIGADAPRQTQKANGPLSAKAETLIRALNEREDIPLQTAAQLRQDIRRDFPGGRWKPSKRDALSFYQRWVAPNNELFSITGLEPFDDDFSTYPDQAEPLKADHAALNQYLRVNDIRRPCPAD